MKELSSILLLTFHLCLFIVPGASMTVVCYFTNWAQYRPSPGKYLVSDIDANKCTHIVFAFAQLRGNLIIPYEPTDDTPDGMWKQLNDLKSTKNPNLKTLLAVGGYTFGTERFSVMSSSAANRQEFTQNAIDLLRYHKFDGLDIDWEYPEKPQDKGNFALLAKETREAFEREAAASNRQRLLLAAAVPAGITRLQTGYNITAMNTYLDIFNVMAYDYHGLWESQTGLASPLYAPPPDTLSVDATMNYYLQQGASKHKLVVGLSFFGRSWTLSRQGDSAVGSPASGGGTAGTFTREPGIVSYYEVCSLLNDGYTPQTEAVGQVKYASKGNQWITYEDRETLGKKLDWIVSNGFGGAMVWALDMDDFAGSYCNYGRYPLLSAVSSRLLSLPNVEENSTVTVATTTSTTVTTQSATLNPATTTSTTSTTTTTTTATSSTSMTTTGRTALSNNSSETFKCPNSTGLFPDPKSCGQFILCSRSIPYRAKCPTGTLFNPSSSRCDSNYTCSMCTHQTGMFPDPTSCSHFIICSAYVPNRTKCPMGTLFNPSSKRCEINYTCPF